jgi:DNA-binding NarL/FixJ family response regulator
MLFYKRETNFPDIANDKEMAKSVLDRGQPRRRTSDPPMFDHQACTPQASIVACLENALMHLASQPVDVVLLIRRGVRSGSGSCADRFAWLRHVSIVLLSDLEDEAMAIQAMQDGTQDYLVKG